MIGAIVAIKLEAIITGTLDFSSHHPYGTTRIDLRNAFFTYPVNGGIASQHWRDIALGGQCLEPFKTAFEKLLQSSTCGEAVACEFDGMQMHGPPMNKGRLTSPVIEVRRIIFGVKRFSKS